MNIEWRNGFEPASDIDMDEIERRFEIKFSDEHRLFLKTITNGGRQTASAPIPTTGYDGEAAVLHGVYGINHPAAYYDMAGALELYEKFLPNLIPFGYDACNCQLYIDMVEIPGRIVYVPRDELDFDQASPPIYHVARSISEFLLLSAKMADEFIDED